MQTLPHLQKRVRLQNGSMHLSKNTCSKLQYNHCLQRTITFRVVVTPELCRECHECVSQLAPFPFQFHVIPFPPLPFPRRGAPFPPPPPSSDCRAEEEEGKPLLPSPREAFCYRFLLLLLLRPVVDLSLPLLQEGGERGKRKGGREEAGESCDPPHEGEGGFLFYPPPFLACLYSQPSLFLSTYYEVRSSSLV